MKLKNKQTGEIGILNYYDGKIQVVLMGMPLCGNSVLGEYETLAELCEEWEDASEEWWFIGEDGFVNRVTSYDRRLQMHRDCKEIGNYFETKEEAEKAVEKLKAWKRLEDRGFKFVQCDWTKELTVSDIHIYADIDCEWSDLIEEDLQTVFGGEE